MTGNYTNISDIVFNLNASPYSTILLDNPEDIIINICNKFEETVYQSYFWYIPFFLIAILAGILKPYWNPSIHWKTPLLKNRPTNNILGFFYDKWELDCIEFKTNLMTFIGDTAKVIIYVRVLTLTILLWLQYHA